MAFLARAARGAYKSTINTICRRKSTFLDPVLLQELEGQFTRAAMTNIILTENKINFVHRGRNEDPSYHGMKVAYFWDVKEQSIRGLVNFGEDCEGPPNAAHGGALAALMDDCTGYSSYLAKPGDIGLMLNLMTEFKKLTPLDETLRIETKFNLEGKDGRKVRNQGVLMSADRSIVYCTAEALFLFMDPAKMKALKH